MNLRELDANLVVVLDALLTETSVTKAADRLGRSPSAISHALANLRALFGDQLFVRAGQRLVPTARAEQLAPTVHVIVAGLEGLLRPQTPFDPASESRAYAIACPDLLELTVLDGLRERLKTAAPNLTLDWAPFETRQCAADLRDGRTDLLISPGGLSGQAADFMAAPLFEDPYVTLARPDHPFLREPPSTAEFIAAEHVLPAPSRPGAGLLDDHLAAHGVAPASVIRSSSAIAGMLIAGRSGALVTVPRSACAVAADCLKLDPIRQPFPQIAAKYRLVWHRRLERDECHLWLRQQMIDHCGALTRRSATSAAPR